MQLGILTHAPEQGTRENSKIMQTTNIELEDKEFRALAEFAQGCAEPMAELMKKIARRDANLVDEHGEQDSDYDFKMVLPIESSLALDRKTLEENYKRIRQIMDWNGIR